MSKILVSLLVASFSVGAFATEEHIKFTGVESVSTNEQGVTTIKAQRVEKLFRDGQGLVEINAPQEILGMEAECLNMASIAAATGVNFEYVGTNDDRSSCKISRKSLADDGGAG